MGFLTSILIQVFNYYLKDNEKAMTSPVPKPSELKSKEIEAPQTPLKQPPPKVVKPFATPTKAPKLVAKSPVRPIPAQLEYITPPVKYSELPGKVPDLIVKNLPINKVEVEKKSFAKCKYN